jgi:F-box-like
MTVVSYHSTLISDIASQEEAAGKTSSQIFLSRGVAGTDVRQPVPVPEPRLPSSASVGCVFESESRQIMSLGNAAAAVKSVVMAGDSTHSVQPRPHQGCDRGKYSFSGEDVWLIYVEEAVDSRPNPYMRPLESTVERIGDTPEDDIIEIAHCRKGKEVDRGRTLEKGSRHPNPLAKAESRPRKNDPTIELDVQAIEKRPLNRSNTFSNFEDPEDPSAILEDNLLEPCPHLSVRNSVSEVLSASESSDSLPGGLMHGSTWSLFETPGLRHPRPARTLTTVFSDCRPVFPAPILPPETLPKIRPDIHQLENIAVLSSTPLWSTTEATPNISAADLSSASSQASRLPTEILQQIFYNLAPSDFNSARHTCRSWFVKSLNRSLLEMMLKRAGFSNRILQPKADQNGDSPNGISIEWSMSKTLALECALGPDWTGNGLARDCTSKSSDSAFVEVRTFFFFLTYITIPECLCHLKSLSLSGGPSQLHISALSHAM